MKVLRILAVALVGTALAIAPTAAHAQASRTYSYSVSGVEVYASTTRGVFSGTAAGSGSAGTWYADVDHTALGTSGADILGGSFGMLLTSASPGHTVTGRFASGRVAPLASGTNCTRQTYSVVGELDPVAAGGPTGAGRFDVVLTHYRKRVFGRCITYAATVSGTVSLTLPA
jgi:hypothetical protein